VVIYWVQNNF
ncbi:CYTH domain protein, partial [Haemophilus influenzae]